MDELMQKIESLQSQINELKLAKETQEAIERAEAEESKRLFNEFINERKKYEAEQAAAAEHIKKLMR